MCLRFLLTVCFLLPQLGDSGKVQTPSLAEWTVLSLTLGKTLVFCWKVWGPWFSGTTDNNLEKKSPANRKRARVYSIFYLFDLPCWQHSYARIKELVLVAIVCFKHCLKQMFESEGRNMLCFSSGKLELKILNLNRSVW